ncbi:TPA: hypothetical protein ACPTZ3_005260, partial [Escherichia coli]
KTVDSSLKSPLNLLLILSILFLNCNDASSSTITITNNCSGHASVVVKYNSDDSDGASFSNTDTIGLDPGLTYKLEIYTDGDTNININAEMNSKHADFSYYGTDKEIIMIDDDFI